MFKKQIIYFIIISIFINYIDICINSKLCAIMPSTASFAISYIHVIDWETVLLDMLRSVFFFDEISFGSVLFVNIIKNNTNETLQTIKITKILIELISKNTYKYNVISIEKLYNTYRELEVFPEDIINSYAFSIDIANYLQSDYMIYGIVYGDSKSPNLELQLICVKTGEIMRVINKSIYK